MLVGYFIDMFNKKLNKDIEGLSSEAMPILMGYQGYLDWIEEATAQ